MKPPETVYTAKLGRSGGRRISTDQAEADRMLAQVERQVLDQQWTVRRSLKLDRALVKAEQLRKGTTT